MAMEVKVTDPASPPSVPLPDMFDSDIIMIPAWLDGDDGVYPEYCASVAKELREAGIGLRWQYGTGNRQWYGERSALVDLITIPFVVGIASSAGWEAIRLVLSRRRGRVRVRIAHHRDADGSEMRWVELEGNTSAIAEELGRLNPWNENGPHPLEEGADD